MMGTIVGTLGLLVLSNPMNFNFLAFVDDALGQLIGSVIAFLVILLIGDNSVIRTRRALLCSLIRPVFRPRLNRLDKTGDMLPALHAYLERLRQVAPADELGQRLAMSLITCWHTMSMYTQQLSPELVSLLNEGELALDGMVHALRPGQRKKSYIRLLQTLRKGRVLSMTPDMKQVFSILYSDLFNYRKSF